MAITFDDYAQNAARTAIYPDAGQTGGLLYAVLGLVGEAGELANQAKKIMRDDNGTIDAARAAKMRAELGDVLWYVAAVARELDVELQEVARYNLQKLERRAADGTIVGDGEHRRALRVGDEVVTSFGARARIIEISPHAPGEVCISISPGHRSWVKATHVALQPVVGSGRPDGLY
jgi:NTP pyrophosphatase (non-canonical NTP hydrolase)